MVIPLKQVIVVEDDELTINLYRQIFELYNIHKVDIEKTLVDACNKAISNDYKLYITDGKYPLDHNHFSKKLDRACQSFVDIIQARKKNPSIVILSNEPRRYEEFAYDRSIKVYCKSDLVQVVSSLCETYLN